MDSVPRAKSQTRHRRRRDILHVAEQLFRERGYLATSMRDIADALKMSGGGSLYAHIDGKEDLLWEIASEAVDGFFAAAEPILALPIAADERLRQVLIAHIVVLTDHLSASAVYFDEWRHLTSPRRDAFLERRDAYERLIETLIREGIAAHLFRSLDPRLATLHILGSVNAIRHWFRPEGRLSAAEIAPQIAAMLLAGLR